MRILHFMNSPLPIEQLVTGGRQLNTSGGWITALLGRLLKDTDFAFASIAFGNVRKVEVSRADRIDSFVVPGAWVGRSTDCGLQVCRDIVNDWKPDVLHIHGTEAAYGLLTARSMVDCPSIVSLQGLAGPYSEWYYYFGNNSLSDIIRMHRWLEIPAMRGQWMSFWRMRKLAKREREIVMGNRFFMGRTAWDRAYVGALNPSARYFHGGELLRESFWHEQWAIGRARRHRVIFTNAGGYPRKGTETLLDAVKLLKLHFPDIEVAVGGGISSRSGYGRFLRARIAELGPAAIELGRLSAQEMVKELVDSHVFVSPSFIDNSPNAVCEAQLLGMPVISTYTGGVPSLIDEGQTGLFVPTGDVPMLAARIKEVFEDDGLAVRLGSGAREAAVRRHDPDAIVREIVAAYEEVLTKSA